MDIEILRMIWFILIGILFVGYSILDGFDLGVGSLLPVLAKKEEDREVMIQSISPLWDGNEVWLLTAGGALFAAFPLAYATVFSGFYLALMLVLFALIFRAVSIEFWKYDDSRKTFWLWTFTLGSLLSSLLFGVAIGNIVYGIPLNSNFDFDGNFFTLLRPYPLAVGLLGFVAMLLQGSSYTALKSEGDLNARARVMTSRLILVYLFLFIIITVISYILLPEIFTHWALWIFIFLVLTSTILNIVMIKKEKDGLTFILSSLSFAGLWGIIGSALFPRLVVSSSGSGHITIHNASSGPLTLYVMLIIALIGMPIVIGYTIYVYRIFKGKVRI